MNLRKKHAGSLLALASLQPPKSHFAFKRMTPPAHQPLTRATKMVTKNLVMKEETPEQQAARKDIEAAFIDNFYALSKMIHNDQKKKGFWDAPRNFGDLIVGMQSQLCAAHEAYYKESFDVRLPHRKSIEVALAVCIICIMDIAAAFSLNIAEAMIERMSYNRFVVNMRGKKDQ